MTGGIINETSLFTSDLQKLKEYTVFKIISISWKLQSATSTDVHTPGERAQWNGAGAKQTRPRVVPHFSSGIVERAKCKSLWKSPHTRKGDARWGERKMRDYRQSPSFWTYALLSQRKTLIGSSMEICQHLSKTRQPLSTLNIITIYRTNNSTEQITRVALVKATKQKANSATDEVRVENRNHGLAWSQIGNNRTVARLLS